MTSILKILRWGINKIPFVPYYRAYRQSRSEFEKSNRQNLAPVIVYQTGRVGSRTVENILDEYYHDSAVLHAHYLNPDGFKYHLEHDVSLGLPRQSATVKQARFNFQSKLLKQDFSDPWKIVSMVRDPAAIILSTFSLHCYHFQHDIVRMVNENSEADLIHDRIDRLFRQEQNYLYEKTASWFDDELLRVFSINIFDSEFSIQKGYQIYKNDRVKVLLIRLEDLNRCYREAFDEFLGIQADNIRQDNSAENLGYSELYRHIRQTVRFSGDYLQNLYEIPWVRHCYSLQEIEDFKSKWV